LIPQNLGQLFFDTVNRFPDKEAFLFKENGRYESISWSEASKKVKLIAGSLLVKGLKAGDRIAILSENRPEWALVDLAAQISGLITVPIYPSLTSAEIEYILSDSGARMIALSSKAQFEKIPPIERSLPLLNFILAFDSSLEISREQAHVPLFILKDFMQAEQSPSGGDLSLGPIRGDSVASIIYTSGTTGIPKGVMLTHQNFIQNVLMCRDALKMGETDKHLSFLPLCHVFERLAGHYLMIHIGATIAYAESMDTVPQNLIETKPTFVLGVPRFYEKITSRVLEAVNQSSSIRKGLFFWAKDLGEKKRKAAFEKRNLGFLFRIEYRLAEKLVYHKFKNRLGGQIRFGVSGGAALSKEIAEFFYDLGIVIYEGYGLTETSPVISVNRENRFKFGSVGIPLEGIEVKLSAEGEILTKGPCVMKGYYNKPEETNAVLKDGWFYTGDLGAVDKEGFLSITGRKKELIVTSGGKKVAPQPIEERAEQDPFILRCVLFGEGRKFITALIVPKKEKVIEYAKNEKIIFTDYTNLLKNPVIYRLFEERVENFSKNLANFEKIKYFHLLENDFSQSSGELTPTLKVKREVVISRYQYTLLPYYEKHGN